MKQLVGDKGWGEGCYLHEEWTESWPSLSLRRCRTLQMLSWELSGCERGLSIVVITASAQRCSFSVGTDTTACNWGRTSLW